MKARKRVELGEHIVSDPEICGGDLTFNGTRVLVRDVLYYVAKGKSWDWVAANYHGLPVAAVAEAVKLANEALIEKAEKKYVVRSAERQRRVA
jgi:uncharacterized protein (DUF433 family)